MTAEQTETARNDESLTMPRTARPRYMLKLPAATPARKLRAVARANGKNQHLHAEEKMAAKAGPFYETSTLVDWLGVSKQALRKRVSKRELLAVQDFAGRSYYPDRQFAEDATVVPGLREVLDTLATGTQSPWTWALWLAGTSKALTGQTAWEALKNGDTDQVLKAAQRDVSRWI